MNDRKKILITGAAGFIGRELCGCFANRPDLEIIGLVRKNRGHGKGVVEFDLSIGLEYEEPVDLIIHAAGRGDSKKNSIRDYINDNINSAMNLIKYAERYRVGKILYLGAVSSYGGVEGILTEDSPRINVSEYGQTKLIGEELIHQSWVESCTLVLPGVVGYGCNMNWLMNCAQKIYKGEQVLFYNGNADFNNVVEVQDFCRFVEKLVDKGSQEWKYKKMLLASEESIKIREILQYMKRKMNSDSELVENNNNRKSFTIDISRARSQGYHSKSLSSILDLVIEETIRRQKGNV